MQIDNSIRLLRRAIPPHGSVVLCPPPHIILSFDMPISTSTVEASFLILKDGDVTGFTITNCRTIQFEVDLSGVTGLVSYKIPKGTLRNQFRETLSKDIDGYFLIFDNDDNDDIVPTEDVERDVILPIFRDDDIIEHRYINKEHASRRI